MTCGIQESAFGFVTVEQALFIQPVESGHDRGVSQGAARKPQSFGVGAFKEWTGISRKYAIPLLEYLDRERITRRDGDRRLIL